VPLLDVDRQLIVVARVGDIDPVTCDPVQATTAGVTGLIMENIGRLWVMYEHKALVDPRLRDLYVMIAAQEIVIARLEDQVSFSGVNGGLSVSLSDRVRARKTMLDAWMKERVLMEQSLSSPGEVSVGLISTTAPISAPMPGDVSSPSLVPDANDPSYSGSPYWRQRART
jgi:hypothetical protein